MGDDKRPPSEKDKNIPLPVAAEPPVLDRKAARKRRFRKLLKHFVFFALFYVVILRWAQVFKVEVEQEAERWLASPFSPHWRPGKGHTILHGKIAEELFLYVCYDLYAVSGNAHEWSSLHRTIPNSASAIAASRQYATKPHMAGTVGDFETAKDFLALLQTELGVSVPDTEPVYSAGTVASRNATLYIPKLDAPTAWIDVYYPVMNTPLNHSVEILGDDGAVVWSAPLEEVADGTDPEAGQYFDAVPAFHGLSKSGEVKGKLVYANYGRQEDYQALIDKGELRWGCVYE